MIAPDALVGALLLPVRNQLVKPGRLEDVAGQDVGTDLRALFDDDHRQAAVELHQPDRGRQTCWSAANNHNVKFH